MTDFSWSIAAIRDMEAVRRYATVRGEQHLYLRLAEIVDRTILQLVANPRIGSPRGFTGLRKLRLRPTPYVLFYRARRDEIRITRVIHGSRDWQRWIK